MGTPKDWTTPHGLGDWMRGQEKRLMHEERRPLVASASDLLGPGFGPRAIETTDLNSEEARSFNGLFFAPVNALNTPDATLSWHVITVATAEHGVQYALSHTNPIQVWMRGVHAHETQTTTFTPWHQLSGGGGSTIDTLDELIDVATAGVLNGHLLVYDSADQTWKPRALTRSDVGLGNVDNTSDANKPVSTAQQTALNGKANTSHTHATSDVTGLDTALAGKASTNHTHTLNDLTSGGSLSPPLVMVEQATPSTPPAGANSLYFKTDGKAYVKDDAGVERLLVPDAATPEGAVKTGTIILWPTENLPSGYLWCDGTVKNVADYPALGAVLGNRYGGDGTTTFGVPNLSGWLTDTATVTSGVLTPQTGWTINSQQFTRRGNFVDFYAQITASALVNNTNLEHTDRTVATIAADWRPTHHVGIDMWGAGLRAAFYRSSDYMICIASSLRQLSGTGSSISSDYTVQANDVFHLSGTWMLDPTATTNRIRRAIKT